MNTLLRKLEDGTIVRYEGEKAADLLEKMQPSAMVIECMFGGIPLKFDKKSPHKDVPLGEYVIEQEGHEHMVADFKKKKS